MGAACVVAGGASFFELFFCASSEDVKYVLFTASVLKARASAAALGATCAGLSKRSNQ